MGFSRAFLLLLNHRPCGDLVGRSKNRRISVVSPANNFPDHLSKNPQNALILLSFVALLEKGASLARIVLAYYMMMFRVTIVAFLTLAGLSSTAQAKLLDIQLSSKKGQVSAWKMNDGYTMMAIVRPAVDGLEDAIRKEMVPGMRFKVTPIHGGSQEVQISLADPILKHSASRKRGRLSFQIHYQTREENMILRIKSRFCAGSIIFRG